MIAYKVLYSKNVLENRVCHINTQRRNSPKWKILVSPRDVLRSFFLYNDSPTLVNHEGPKKIDLHFFKGPTWNSSTGSVKWPIVEHS